MNTLIRRLPLLAKLMLIGLIPFCFLVYLTIQVYKDKTQKLKLFENYKTYIAESANINGLIDALQEERKFSFDYAITKGGKEQLLLQRPRTDSLLQKLKSTNDPSLLGFTNYTKLEQLSGIRTKIDSFRITPDAVMHFYSNGVFRLNTLNTLPPANTAYLQSVYKDLIAQKILSEMMTYLGIIRSNVYNVLYTRKYMVETLFGTLSTHDVYNSYEQEFMAKVTPELLAQYKNVKNTTALKPTMDYLDTLFKHFAFDSSFTAPEWWRVSDEGVNALRNFQSTIWKNLNDKVNALYQHEQSARSYALFFLIFALIMVVLVVAYIVFIINRSLQELRLAAEKISEGETGVHTKAESNDAIGGLAQSIANIDKNNQILAQAAVAIGKGNFNVKVKPRSKDDVLGNAIVEMKNELQQYSEKMEQLVAQRTEELARSNEDLQQFAHVASHDLKEPLRKITTFSSILNAEQKDLLTEKGKLYLHKIETASQRMAKMIEGVLTYSMVRTSEYAFELVDLNKILEEVQNDLELAIIQKEAQIRHGLLPRVNGFSFLLQQLFYNLINNALKFSKPGVPPVIKIDAKPLSEEEKIQLNVLKMKKQYVQISVCDNGIGFRQEDANKIFKTFTRLNSKDKYEGTGLGLALCKKIAERHEGTIYATSKEGEGACFYVVLPE